MNGIDRQNQPLSSRVERRVVLAFLLFTLVPLTVLGYLGVGEIERQALQRAQAHLEATTASYADALLDRLGTLETELRLMLEMSPDVGTWATRLPQVQDVQISAEATDSLKLSTISFDLGAFWLGIPTDRNRVWFQIDLEQIRGDLGESGYGGRTCVYMGDVEYLCGIEEVAIPHRHRAVAPGEKLPGRFHAQCAIGAATGCYVEFAAATGRRGAAVYRADMLDRDPRGDALRTTLVVADVGVASGDTED